MASLNFCLEAEEAVVVEEEEEGSDLIVGELELEVSKRDLK